MTIERSATRLAAQWWLVLLFSALALAGCLGFGLTERIDNGLYDIAMRAESRRLDPRLLIVTIDDRALAEVGAWPWPRERYARMLDALHAGGARGAALDVLLLQPASPAGDAALAHALREDSPVFLPVAFEVPGHNGASHETLMPLAMFRENAAGLGHVNLAFDADGTVRRVYLTYTEQSGAYQRTWPQLASLLAGARPAAGALNSAPGAVLEARSPAMIGYAGPQGTIPSVSAAAVLRGEVPEGVLKGRLVLIGAAASGLGDSYATPVGRDGSLMPGIEIQANLLNALLTGTLITPVGGAALFLASLVPLVLLMVAMRLLPPRWTLPAIAVLFVGTAGTSGALLLFGHMWLAPGASLIGLIALYPAWTWRRLATVSAYMSAELEKLDREHDPLERPRPDLAHADVVGRQMGLLRSAIDRERDLRKFLIERIAQMPDAVLVTNRDGKVVLANDGARRLCEELTTGGEPQHADMLLTHLLAETGTAPALSFAEIGALDTGLSRPARDATGRTYELRVEPQRSAIDEPIGFVLRIADTTSATLMRRQREDVLELLSHDMRSPQASILAVIEGAESGAIAPEPAAPIKGLARRTLGLADDFVHLARAEMMPIHFEDLDFAGLAQDAAEAVWPQTRLKGITLTTDLPDDALVVMGDASLLTRALTNLVDNAVKFAGEGGHVWLEVVAIPVNDGQPARVAARVRDDGPGIPTDQLELIFERFRRAPTGPMRDVGGSGLGLAFVHTVATRHGGQVSCQSAPGEGACFTFELPLSPDEPV